MGAGESAARFFDRGHQAEYRLRVACVACSFPGSAADGTRAARPEDSGREKTRAELSGVRAGKNLDGVAVTPSMR